MQIVTISSQPAEHCLTYRLNTQQCAYVNPCSVKYELNTIFQTSTRYLHVDSKYLEDGTESASNASTGESNTLHYTDQDSRSV